AILETNTSHPGPAVERVHPAKGRYCECVVGRAICEGLFEVIGDKIICTMDTLRRPASLRLAKQRRCTLATEQPSAGVPLRHRATTNMPSAVLVLGTDRALPFAFNNGDVPSVDGSLS